VSLDSPTGERLAVQQLTVGAEADGARLDKALAMAWPQISRSRIRQWIDAGRVRVNGAPQRASTVVYAGDRIEVEPLAAPEASAFVAEAMALDVVYQDEALLVLDKPPGLVVHPAAGHWSGTLLNGLLAYEPALAALPRAGIVHRLDADTSGLMVVARTAAAQTDLVRQLQAHSVTREYWALVYGVAPAAGTIAAALARDPRRPVRFTTSRAAAAKPACTHFRLIRTVDLEPLRLSWVACRLETGRTHQIRVHLESIGHPLVGDPLYRKGRPPLRDDDPRQAPLAAFTRQALHACRLHLRHPLSGREQRWFRAPPADLQQLMKALGLRGTRRAVEAF
jgi:23S rRNA pseudouridine1911/1915/1917 synthase